MVLSETSGNDGLQTCGEADHTALGHNGSADLSPNLSAADNGPQPAGGGSHGIGSSPGRAASIERNGRRRYERLRRDPLAQALVMRLARRHRISLRDLMQAGRGSGNASHTRQIAMYLCYVLLRRTQEQLGELFNRDRKTVSHACAQIELQRESDRLLDAELTLFETEGWMEAARRERELQRHAA